MIKNQAENIFKTLHKEFEEKAIQLIKDESYELARLLTEGSSDEFFDSITELAQIVVDSYNLKNKL